METDGPGDVAPSESKPQKMQSSSAKDLIEKYFRLLTEGCGNAGCTNQYCASSPTFYREPLSPNDAALEAIRLVKDRVAVICESLQQQSDSIPSVSNNVMCTTCPDDSSVSPVSSVSSVPAASSSNTFSQTPISCLSKEIIVDTIMHCEKEGKWSELVKLVGSAFSDPDVLAKSFLSSDNLTLDRQSLQQSYSRLFSIPEEIFFPALNNAVSQLTTTLKFEFRYHPGYERHPAILNVIVMLFDLPCLDQPEFIESAYPSLLECVSYLPLNAQKELVKLWSKESVDHLKYILTSLHQLITIRIVSQSDQWNSNAGLNEDDQVTSAAKVMKLLYFASILGGRSDPEKVVNLEKINYESLQKSIQEYIENVAERPAGSKDTPSPLEDPLSKELGIEAINCRLPLIASHEFINEMVNETIDMEKDFTYYKARTNKFTFIKYPFLLNTATKSMAMYFDNRIRMVSERRSAIFASVLQGRPSSPYLKLKVRRDHIIADTLIALEMVFMDNPDDLKKQLYVEFEGEQGIDEGGVSKEFFQLLTEEIFNPDYGMFIYDADSKLFWFNPDSYENDAQFTLVGILLGLAIYNHIILDVRLPLVVYRKLMGKLGALEDMQISHPVLFSSLMQLLNYEGNIEDDLMTNFTLSRTNMFGCTVVHPLKEGGADVLVNAENRQEFCHLYADYLLNKSVEKQFNAFYKGFHLVIDESPLEMLFSPVEIEVLVCGSDDWDLHALEDSTEYDGGFDKNSDTIRHFWQVVHGMTVEEQKQLLQFTTGSDRVPVGGLAKLKLVIAKNGAASDRLPTSHTCFNVLLLPDYQDFAKLKDRLMLAITHAKGFGLL